MKKPEKQKKAPVQRQIQKKRKKQQKAVLQGFGRRFTGFPAESALKEGFFLDGDNIVYADGKKNRSL